METPVPIPNTEVKRLSADDTRGATLWENMPLPEGLAKSFELRHSLCIAQYSKYPEALTLLSKRLIILIGSVGLASRKRHKGQGHIWPAGSKNFQRELVEP